jgi:predicted P-loop ATPase
MAWNGHTKHTRRRSREEEREDETGRQAAGSQSVGEAKEDDRQQRWRQSNDTAGCWLHQAHSTAHTAPQRTAQRRQTGSILESELAGRR